MKDQIQVLLDKARQSFQAASLLEEEGYLDFAASRAYYAMFYAAKALLLSRGLSYSSHSALIAAFGKEFVQSGELDATLHRHFIDAQDLRNQGDHSLGLEMSAAQVEELLGWAQEFMASARNYLSDV